MNIFTALEDYGLCHDDLEENDCWCVVAQSGRCNSVKSILANQAKKSLELTISINLGELEQNISICTTFLKTYWIILQNFEAIFCFLIFIHFLFCSFFVIFLTLLCKRISVLWQYTIHVFIQSFEL